MTMSMYIMTDLYWRNFLFLFTDINYCDSKINDTKKCTSDQTKALHIDGDGADMMKISKNALIEPC